MSTETPSTPAIVNPNPAMSPNQSSMAADHAKPQAAAHRAATAIVAAPHACCHDVSAAAPAVRVGSAHAGEAGKVAGAASHTCTNHKAGAELQALVKDLASADAGTRIATVMAMGKLADCAAAAPLIGALKDADADVAREAAVSLGMLGDASAVEPLIAVVQNAEGFFHPVVRTAATFSLGQLHDLRAFAALVEAIHDPIAETSAEAIRSLAKLGDQRAVAALLAVIRNVDGFYLQTSRRAAILGLAKLGGEQAESELRFVSTNRWEDAVVRDAAIGATCSSSPAISAG
jgi:HEAT repeat protein